MVVVRNKWWLCECVPGVSRKLCADIIHTSARMYDSLARLWGEGWREGVNAQAAGDRCERVPGMHVIQQDGPEIL